MPKNARSSFKIEQIEALNKVRPRTTQSNERSYLNQKAIEEQVQATLALLGVLSLAGVHNSLVNTSSPAGFGSFGGDPSMHMLTDDKINTYVYDDAQLFVS